MSQYVINGVGAVNIETLLAGSTSTDTGAAVRAPRFERAIHAWLAGNGGEATVDIEVSNDPSALATPGSASWVRMATLYLSGVSDKAGFETSAKWAFIRARVAAISGGAVVTATMGH